MKRAPGPPTAPEKPRQPGRIRAVFLAVVVHAAFFTLIVFGVTWQSRRDTSVQLRGLCKAQLDRIESLQHRVVQFPSYAAAIVQQGGQTLFGCLEGRGETASDLFPQQIRKRL